MHVHASPTGKTARILQFSLVATFAYVVLTFVFGLRAHSLALLSEAGHNVSDFLALGLSFFAVYMHSRPANDQKTFGYQRTGVLAAFVNALTLIVLSVWLAIAAVHRFAAPVLPQPRVMMVVAAAGLVMNGLIAFALSRAGKDVNIRSVCLHMLGDALSTAAVIVGGIGIYYTGLNWIDPLLSLLIAAMILYSSVGIVRETLNILLEGTPQGLSLPEIRLVMQSVGGVEDVHDLHVWSLGSSSHALASHVTIADIPPSESTRILEEIRLVLGQRFRIHHTTIQFEHAKCEVAHGCVMAIDEHEAHHHHGHAHSL